VSPVFTDATFTGAPDDPRFVAGVDLIGRSGASEVQIRYDDEQDPVVWIAYAKWKHGEEAAGCLDPLGAVMRLLRLIIDPAKGSKCAHCGRPSDITDDWANAPTSDGEVCLLVFDPETKAFRRSCEGETTGYAYGRDPATGLPVGRNDPCPCGSGQKWKRCHGA
jgi:hypothetical protein